MKVFVSGAAGFQGGNIANTLVQAGHQVTSIRRKAEDINSGTSQVVFHQGDLAKAESLNDAFKGADAAVFTFPLTFDMDTAKQYTSNFIAAAKANGVDFIVFNPTSDVPDEETGYLVIDMKIASKKLLDASGLKVITLLADVYIDNISAPWSIPLIMEKGILPYPVSATDKTPFVSHSDLGKYVLSALQKPELAGKTLPIGGNLLSGEEIAKTIASHIGKDVNFISLTPDAFQSELTAPFGEVAATEISNAYRHFEKNKESILKKNFSKTNELLSITPQSLEEWVASVKWS